MKKILVSLAFAYINLVLCTVVKAQCAMCSANANNSTQNGNHTGAGLNNGILFLLSTPFIAIAVVGYIWYTYYRRKEIPLDIEPHNIHLN